MDFQVMPRAELIDYLEERERRTEALYDRIDRRLGAIEDRLLTDPPLPCHVREGDGIEAGRPSKKAGRKTDGVLKVGHVIHMLHPVTWSYGPFFYPAMYSQACMCNVGHRIPQAAVCSQPAD